MNGLINLIQGNGKETQLSVAQANSVSLENINRVDLPFNRDDISKITFEEGKLGLHLKNGSKVTFDAVIDQLGALVPIYENSGSLLFNDLGEILAQLEKTAGGPEPLPTVEGTSNYTPEENNFRVDLIDGVDTYRDLRGPLDNPAFTSTSFDGLNTENDVLDNGNITPPPSEPDTNNIPTIATLSATDVLEDVLIGSLTETVTDPDANSSYSFVVGTVEATVVTSAQHGGSNIVSDLQVTIDSNGDYSISGSGIESLSAGETATISFAVKVIDDQSAESLPKTVTLDIIGSNDAPVITALSTADVFEDNLTGSLIEIVTDADANSSYDFVAETVTATVTSSAQHGGIDIVSDVQVTIDANGDYSITGSGIDALSIGEIAEISFNVKVIDDQSAESVEQQVSLSILGKHFNPRLDSVVSNSINDFARSKTLTLNQKQLWQNDLDGDGHNDITDGDFPPPFTNASGYWKTLDIIESSVKVTAITYDGDTGNNLNVSSIGLDEAVLKNLYNDPTNGLMEVVNTADVADFVRFHINDNALPDSDFNFLKHGESLNFTIEYRLIDSAGNPSNLTTTTMTVEGQAYRLAGSNLLLTDDALDIDLLLTDPALNNSVAEVKLALNSSQTLNNLDAQDILDLTDDSTKTLLISGDDDDSVIVLGTDWTDSGTETIGTQLFNVFEKDSAILKVDADIDTTIDTI
ncbi:VCBS domain-containing protein [Amphritea sp. HPY]|uniref:VCBS domain-containing protein n=1 Tax=Amphritea sp. HPY TaxID=3421652 RepID=UPI003D7D80F9